MFTGSVQGVPAQRVAPGKVPLALGLAFLNGGGAKNAEVQVSATLRPRWPTYKGYEAYTFNIDFDDTALQAFKVDNGRQDETLILDKQPVRLDQGGAGKLDVILPAKPKGPSEVYAEDELCRSERRLSQQVAQLETQAALAKTTFERQKRLWDKNRVWSPVLRSVTCC